MIADSGVTYFSVISAVVAAAQKYTARGFAIAELSVSEAKHKLCDNLG